jgi:uncharacterized RDD family membrane protein YckC
LSPSSQNVGENLSRAGVAVVPAWKKELNERLAATRSRRIRNIEQQVPLPGLEHIGQKVESRASRLAAKVAQRYANAPSYSELLAAEVHARLQTETVTTAAGDEDIPAIQAPPGLLSSWDGSLGTRGISLHQALPEPAEPAVASLAVPAEEPVNATVEPLAVNVIEVPRELVAARKVRPRLAEGPLRATFEETEHDRSQLRIFEVAAESISQTVSIGSAADWSSIRLDIDPLSPLVAGNSSHSEQIPLKVAPLEDRLMAGIFDLALIFAAFAIFVLVFVACTAHPPTGKPALLAAGLVLAGFCLLYQYLFFKFAEGTPGMRYAKIALCTFDDENPTRKAMCRRVVLLLLSAAPLGLGFVWACFDADRMGWHDRMSRIYQRSYS